MTTQIDFFQPTLRFAYSPRFPARVGSPVIPWRRRWEIGAGALGGTGTGLLDLNAPSGSGHLVPRRAPEADHRVSFLRVPTQASAQGKRARL
jgi:hypothetical protein